MKYEYKFTAITDHYDIWGNVLMGLSGYLHQKLTILSITGKTATTWLLSALQDLPHISDRELTDCLVSTTYNEKCELTTTAKKSSFS
jgi:hypothetical protein